MCTSRKGSASDQSFKCADMTFDQGSDNEDFDDEGSDDKSNDADNNASHDEEEPEALNA